METFLSTIQTLSLVAGAVGLLMIGYQLHRFYNFITRNSLQVTVSQLHWGTSQTTVQPKWGYAVYMWTEGLWVLNSDMSAPGCEASKPTMPGSYEGQLVKKESEPR